MYTTFLNQQRDQELPEQRLWAAVIARTLEEWVSGPVRRQREAEQFLFDDKKDFLIVCQSAGLDPDQLRTRLQRFRKGSEGLAA